MDAIGVISIFYINCEMYCSLLIHIFAASKYILKYKFYKTNQNVKNEV